MPQVYQLASNECSVTRAGAEQSHLLVRVPTYCSAVRLREMVVAAPDLSFKLGVRKVFG